MSLQSELMTLTGVKAKKGEDRQAFLRRLWDKTDTISEEAWEKLETEGQNWINAATKADAAGSDLPDFPDATDDTSAASEQEEKTKVRKTKSANGKGGKAPTTAKKAAAKEKAPRAAAALKEDGLKFRIKSAIIDKPSITVDELVTKLSKGGEKVSKVTITGVRADFRHSLKVLRHHDVLAKSVEI